MCGVGPRSRVAMSSLTLAPWYSLRLDMFSPSRSSFLSPITYVTTRHSDHRCPVEAGAISIHMHRLQSGNPSKARVDRKFLCTLKSVIKARRQPHVFK